MRYIRPVVIGITALGLIASNVAGVGGIRSSASAAAPAAQYKTGIPGAVAAKALNALASKDRSNAKNAVTVKFILNWLPNVEFSGLWVAQKYGWWKQAGINMTFTPWTPSVHPETQVPETGGDTFGFQSAAAIGIARAQGVNITALYADAEKSVFALTVLASSHINKLTQLKGKRIGYQPHELYVPQTMLASRGMLINKDWRPVPVGFDITWLTQKRVDAYLTFLTNEPIALQLQGVKTRSFPAADYGFHFYDDVLFTYNGLIQKDPALVRKVVRIVARGFNWAHNLPDQAARITVNGTFPAGKGETARNHLEQQILESRAFRQFSRDPNGRYSGLMTTAYWQDSINTLFKYHEISSKPSASTIYTNRFNPYR